MGNRTLPNGLLFNVSFSPQAIPGLDFFSVPVVAFPHIRSGLSGKTQELPLVEEVFFNVAINKLRDWIKFFWYKRFVKLLCEKIEYHEGRNGITLKSFLYLWCHITINMTFSTQLVYYWPHKGMFILRYPKCSSCCNFIAFLLGIPFHLSTHFFFQNC